MPRASESRLCILPAVAIWGSNIDEPHAVIAMCPCHSERGEAMVGLEIYPAGHAMVRRLADECALA